MGGIGIFSCCPWRSIWATVGKIPSGPTKIVTKNNPAINQNTLAIA